jgi:hypothetical protein
MTKTEKRILKTVLGTVGGGLVGLAISPASVVTNMCMDLTAPVSYPVQGAIVGACMPAAGGETDPAVILAGATGGTLGATVHIPFAPLHFCTRWLTTPLVNTVVFAAAGGGITYMLTEEE